MQYHTRAFTLIELIISIAISMILMVSIGVFITSGMKHITVQKNILQNHGDTQEFLSEVEDIFQRENLVFATGSAS
jgi:prepilin-type N-terminal cleavage/methylation domain-containing protein